MINEKDLFCNSTILNYSNELDTWDRWSRHLFEKCRTLFGTRFIVANIHCLGASLNFYLPLVWNVYSSMVFQSSVEWRRSLAYIRRKECHKSGCSWGNCLRRASSSQNDKQHWFYVIWGASDSETQTIRWGKQSLLNTSIQLIYLGHTKALHVFIILGNHQINCQN